MKKHTKNYTEHFGYCEQDFIPSEISGKPANDLHHIEYGRFKRSDEVENIIALTRREHDRAHFKQKPYLSVEELQKIHKHFMERHKSKLF